MMSVVALSLPEMMILRKVFKVPLIAVFAGVVAASGGVPSREKVEQWIGAFGGCCRR